MSTLPPGGCAPKWSCWLPVGRGGRETAQILEVGGQRTRRGLSGLGALPAAGEMVDRRTESVGKRRGFIHTKNMPSYGCSWQASSHHGDLAQPNWKPSPRRRQAGRANLTCSIEGQLPRGSAKMSSQDQHRASFTCCVRSGKLQIL
ncbi:hypothetical protein Cadr_000027608 [Camelus dromedarius]|uniref:Uncharacterized protein n=1 Tax=Camelus dromedarius TaxID=9838 RepID=A0A5N4CBW7_CAMDR|nr:hypothetical protein Cadr_000027608 [Camelus dromedarius]